MNAGRPIALAGSGSPDAGCPTILASCMPTFAVTRLSSYSMPTVLKMNGSISQSPVESDGLSVRKPFYKNHRHRFPERHPGHNDHALGEHVCNDRVLGLQPLHQRKREKQDNEA